MIRWWSSAYWQSTFDARIDSAREKLSRHSTHWPAPSCRSSRRDRARRVSTNEILLSRRRRKSWFNTIQYKIQNQIAFKIQASHLDRWSRSWPWSRIRPSQIRLSHMVAYLLLLIRENKKNLIIKKNGIEIWKFYFYLDSDSCREVLFELLICKLMDPSKRNAK